MLGTKYANNVLLILGIFALVACLGFYFSKNSSWPRQVKQDIFRIMVGQEINLRTAQFDEITTEHYRIKYLTVDEPYIDMVTTAAEEAYTSVSDMLGQEPKKQTTIVIYPDNSSLAKSFGWDKDEKAMGVYWGGSIRILSPREWLSGLDNEERFIKEGPMVHEFTHLLVDDITGGNYNRWWTEGVAQYAEKKITGFEFSSPFSGGREFKYYTLENLEKNFDNLDQSIAYWESLKAVEFLISQHGDDKLYEILRYLGNGNSMTGAMEKSLGIDYETFEYEFYQYLEKM